ncbi:MAG: hydrogenase [Gemmatimonadetes bacterium]|nr:hydrogenase [Gemmatimonadota bacterium]
MKILKLPKEQLDFFASVLQQFGEVHAPVRTRAGYSFRALERWSEACLDYDRTVLPPKKYFLPPRETMLTYRRPDGYVAGSEGLNQKLVLFGVHACDIFALNLLDKVFAEGVFPDPYYRTRRRNVAVIGIDCEPDEHCFCPSMRADFVERGFDLFFYDIGDHYLVMVGTALGDDMVLATGPLFTPVADADIVEYKRRSALKKTKYQLEVDLRDLPEIFELEYGSEIWEELGRTCLACGNCSTSCPTCYCYDVQDQVELGSTEGPRVRTADTCLYSQHAAVAGGENFRHSQASRIKFYYYHKQRGFVMEHGRPGCVGCGRCIVHCPVGIHVVDVINRLRGVRDAVASH